MTADTSAGQGERDVDAAVVRTLARAAGLALAAERARIVAPYLSDALHGDVALAGLDMGDAPAAGLPWDGVEGDD